MIGQPEQSSIRFRALADKLFTLKKITSDVAEQAKNRYDELLNLVKYEKNDEFCNFDFNKERVDAFLAKYLTSDSYKDLYYICKLIFVISCQSNVKRGFSVNKEVLQDQLLAKSLISQRLIYDTFIYTDSELQVSPYHLHFIKVICVFQVQSRFGKTKRRKGSCGAVFKT